MSYLILMATNMMTDKNDVPWVYIELTEMSFAQRKHFHLYHSQLENPKELIHSAIKYLGPQYFKWEILDETENKDDAEELLKYYRKEYRSEEIGYNRLLDVELAGEANPRYGDHRTWEELHGKEKAEQLRQTQIKNFTGNASLSEHMKRRLEVWNPMDDPAAVEKVRQSKMGVKNPAAVYDYVFTKPDGTEIVVNCMREFCRANPTYRRSSIVAALKAGKPYKGMTIRKIPKCVLPEAKVVH